MGGKETKVFLDVPSGCTIPERGCRVRESVEAAGRPRERSVPTCSAKSTDTTLIDNSDAKATEYCGSLGTLHRAESYRRCGSRGLGRVDGSPARSPLRTTSRSFQAIRATQRPRRMSEPVLTNDSVPSASMQWRGLTTNACSAHSLPPTRHHPRLHTGMAWPRGEDAKKAAEDLLAQMWRAPPEDRVKLVRCARLRWHPDKNIKNEAMATEMFLFVQALREVFLAGGASPCP